MNELKDTPTFILVELCKGHWQFQIGLKPDVITKEMITWTNDCKLKIIEEIKKELVRRGRQ